MTDEKRLNARTQPTDQAAQPTPHPVPQPTPTAQTASQPVQVQYVPAIQGVSIYYAIGTTPQGPQMYSYDVNLDQWRTSQPHEMEQVMISLGIPANVINAMKNLRF